ncbi:MAG TPA: hypothetical protein VIW03_03490, partial [Anaeromyxobacter sp.]
NGALCTSLFHCWNRNGRASPPRRYWIPAFWVPALLVTHYVAFAVLWRSRRSLGATLRLAAAAR